MKKCLSCNNKIFKINHYVCSDCYKEIKLIKEELLMNDEKTLKAEYNRWKRNLYLSRNVKYKNDYQKRIIAIAEIYQEKYRKDNLINQIIDYSNNQTTIEIEKIKISEEELEEQHIIDNKDKEVDINKYKTWLKCNDGHRVISKSEQIIDNLLTEKRIRHSYDMEIDDNTNYRYDFKLLDYENVFIEHWGYKNKKNYNERKKLKKDYYNQNNYILIESDEDTIKDPKHLIKQLREKVPGIFDKTKK